MKKNESTLMSLAKKYGTDKLSHGYIPHYENIFKKIKDKKLDILEIGVREGWSHLMWGEYFKNSRIYGIDNFASPIFKDPNKRRYNFKNIKVFIGDQTDEQFLDKSINFNLDIIIDDGGHKISHHQISLGNLFRKLRPGGFYIIEDLDTCNIEKYIDVPDRKFTTLNFLKNINNKDVESFFIKGNDLKYIQNNIRNINLFNEKLAIIEKI